jgi:hypothetical protein
MIVAVNLPYQKEKISQVKDMMIKQVWLMKEEKAL